MMEGKPVEVTKKKLWKCTYPVEVETYLENLKENKAILERLVSIVNTCNNRYNEGLITAAEAIAAITLAAAYAETESF